MRGLNAGLSGLCAALALAVSTHAGAQSALAAPKSVELPPIAAREVPPALSRWLPPGVRTEAEARTTTAGELHWLVEHVDLEAGPAPRPATDLRVEYTIDPGLEEAARRSLAARGVDLGHVVVLDVQTGDVLAYVSTDPDHFPATRPYPMASLMKVVTAAAVLEHSPEVTRRSCRYLGSPYDLLASHLDPPRAGGRVQSFPRALAVSNNQCFARFAVRDLGEETLLSEVERVGILDPPGAGHEPGVIDPVRGRLALGHLGSGMSGSAITPLGAARLSAALAHGELVEPRWIAQVRDANGTLIAVPERHAAKPLWPRELADSLRTTMIAVTEQGTARRAFRPGGTPRLGPIRVAGKTGTRSGRDPAGLYRWFIGVAPAEAPRIAVATLAVGGAPRGADAVGVAADVLGAIFCAGECAVRHGDALLARARAREEAVGREMADAEHERQLARDLRNAYETARSHTVVDLDQAPRPVERAAFDFPGRLARRSVSGRIVLLLDLGPDGQVLGVEVDSSDLPDYEPTVIDAVRTWRFTPPTRGGEPVRATARMPIAIELNPKES